MKTEQFHRWLMLAANLGVLAGLIVLIVEIRQSSAIAEAQFYMSQVETNKSVEFALLGDNAASVWERSVFDAKSLSPADIRVMDAYLVSRVYIWQDMLELERRDFIDAGATAANIRDSVEFFFGSAFAQDWWAYERKTGDWPESLARMIDSAMQTTDSSANRNRIIELRSLQD